MGRSSGRSFGLDDGDDSISGVSSSSEGNSGAVSDVTGGGTGVVERMGVILLISTLKNTLLPIDGNVVA